MLRTSKHIIAVTLSILVISWMAVDSGALGLGKKDKPKPKTKHGNSFSTAGEFSGMIKGTMVIGGREFVVTEDTVVYVSGKGRSESDLFVSNASVYVGGVVKRGVARAAFVIVRPEKSSHSLERRSFKASRHWVRCPSNPNIFMSTSDYQE